MTYISILELLVKTDDIKSNFDKFCKSHALNKLKSANDIKDYLIKNFTVKLEGKLTFPYSFKDKTFYIIFTRYSKRITYKQSILIYNFFFTPVHIKRTYPYEI